MLCNLEFSGSSQQRLNTKGRKLNQERSLASHCVLPSLWKLMLIVQKQIMALWIGIGGEKYFHTAGIIPSSTELNPLLISIFQWKKKTPINFRILFITKK